MERRLLWRGVGLIALFNGLLAGWLLFGPADRPWFAVVDNVAQFVGPLLMLAFCCAAAEMVRRRAGGASASPEVVAARRRVAVFLWLGVLSWAVGQAIWTYYEHVLHRPVPVPSWADAAFLGAYPFLLLGVLLVPTQPLSLAARARLVLDSLMTLTSVVTFNWYFILGPTLAQGTQSTAAKVVSAAYPLCDMVLLCCLLALAAPFRDAAGWRIARIMAVGLLAVVVTDGLFQYRLLRGAYATGTLLDAGWPVGYMTIALAGLAVWLAVARQPVVAEGHREASPVGAAPWRRSWPSFLPYALIPALGVLLIYTGGTEGDQLLDTGVYVGAVVLLALIVLRQVLAIVENRELYDRLHDAYGRLAGSNAETVEYARRLEELNEELRGMHDELAANNRALAEANSRLETLATIDPLTGLPNHRGMVAALDRELGRARRYHQPCAILFLDLDHFKALNDTYGHTAGDAALREFGQVLRATLRGVDTVGRWGGEEFVAVLPQTDAAAAVVAAEHVRGAVAAHAFTSRSLRLTCSLGVAAFPHAAPDRNGLIAAADRAMYAAKRLGRNQARAVGDPALAVLSAEEGGRTSREDLALAGTVEALTALVEARDQYTGRHTDEVAQLATRLAQTLDCDAEEAHMIGLAARLHDVGKVIVPDIILRKQGSLTADEWATMRTHPVVGADVASRVPALRALAPIVRAHHEHWDGGGYPDGLAGSEIPLGARIVSVVDAYKAMTTDRPYSRARPPEVALVELRRCAGTQFDPVVVAALERLLAADEADEADEADALAAGPVGLAS